jgi:hypothetical protein
MPVFHAPSPHALSVKQPTHATPVLQLLLFTITFAFPARFRLVSFVKQQMFVKLAELALLFTIMPAFHALWRVVPSVRHLISVQYALLGPLSTATLVWLVL